MSEKPGRQKKRPNQGPVPTQQPQVNKPGGGAKKTPTPSPNPKPGSGRGGNRSEIA